MTSASALPARPPVVSVIMANHNGAAYLADAIASVRRQSLSELELIVSDDASTDDSARIVGEAIAGDPRIRLVRSTQNSGPAAARNKALALARGDWIAVMDSDDLMHPDRLERLVEAAERDGADIAADDLVEFETDRVRRLACSPANGRASPFWVDIRDYIRLNMFYGPGPALGYLKPLFRRFLMFRPAGCAMMRACGSARISISSCGSARGQEIQGLSFRRFTIIESTPPRPLTGSTRPC